MVFLNVETDFFKDKHARAPSRNPYFMNFHNANSSNVSNWEKGLTRPDVDTLAIICAVLQVSADELLDIRLLDNAFTQQERKIILRYRSKPELQQAIHILLATPPAAPEFPPP